MEANTYRSLPFYRENPKPPKGDRGRRRAAARGIGNRSHFRLVINRDGVTAHRGRWDQNLTTDSASGFTNRRDWQSKLMAGGLLGNTYFSGNATSISSTSLTNTGATFPTSGQGMAGMIVVAGPNASGTGALAFGMIQSNTATVLTVDQWYNPQTLAAATTPNGTCSYVVVPGNMPAAWLALSADSSAASASDTTIGSSTSGTELTTNGLGRALATYAHTAAASTYTLTYTWTCSGGSTTLNMYCASGSAVASKGPMPFESSISSPPTVISGDQVTVTDTITIN